MRRLTFELITDNRLDDEYTAHFKIYSDKIITELSNLDGIKLEYDAGRGIEFCDGTKQYRKRFYITKTTRKMTWNDVMKKINDIKICAYDWC